MYPTDVKEFTANRLVAHIAKALAGAAPLDLRALYDELDLQPTTIASYHAAAAAVHVLLAHEAGTTVADVVEQNGNGRGRQLLLAGGALAQKATPANPAGPTTARRSFRGSRARPARASPGRRRQCSNARSATDPTARKGD